MWLDPWLTDRELLYNRVKCRIIAVAADTSLLKLRRGPLFLDLSELLPNAGGTLMEGDSTISTLRWLALPEKNVLRHLQKRTDVHGFPFLERQNISVFLVSSILDVVHGICLIFLIR